MLTFVNPVLSISKHGEHLPFQDMNAPANTLFRNAFLQMPDFKEHQRTKD